MAVCLRWASAGALIVALLVGSNADDLKVLAAAQTVTATTGAVNGIVTDSTKAVVPGVTVSLSGPSLMTTRTTVTDDAGAYRFSAVPTGDHTLTFELAGFATFVRDGIHVGLGFTATVNAEMSPSTVSRQRHRPWLAGCRSFVDDSDDPFRQREARESARRAGRLCGPGQHARHRDGEDGRRWERRAHPAGVHGVRPSRATTGVNRNEVEGIRVGGANGPNDNYFSDFASFAEIAITAVGHTAAMSVPGTLAQYVSKSGGDTYHGSAVRGLPERQPGGDQHR